MVIEDCTEDIGPKLSMFSKIWAVIRSDIQQIRECTALASSNYEHTLFPRRVERLKELYSLLVDALEVYECHTSVDPLPQAPRSGWWPGRSYRTNIHESLLPRSHRRVISPEEDVRHLFQECTIARRNARLLSKALTSANPGDIEKEAIREFYAKCQASQELIYSQIPWSTSGAERSRAERSKSEKAGPASESTIEEELLVALVNANNALHDALRKHDDHKRIGVERIVPEIGLPISSPREQHQHRIDQSLGMPMTTPPVIADESSAEPERLSPAPDANADEGRTGHIRRTSLMWLERHGMTLYRNIVESDSFEGPEWVREASTDYIYDMKIYQSLTVYTFLHLTHCVKDPSLLSAFHTHIKAWKEWDVMQSLKHHRIIRDRLHALLVKVI
ncbi:hypothetical protein BV22DRAFT_793339 [Leucogyrophana mollusca]|uniref:Uncharacterized protein n=1 Tax=Leucogyrophana mollusca TaxID=85980 RepID=A0ACB8B593_9AGAM|nr:hypothetical protein BV22DRAFT_793339 [Leucogyrophana mollusca]